VQCALLQRILQKWKSFWAHGWLFAVSAGYHATTTACYCCAHICFAEVQIREVTTRRPISKALQVAVFRRDGWLCCWCKRPVIFAPVMKFLELEIRASVSTNRLAYYHAHWTRDGAPLLDLLGAVIDHIEAFSTGGADHIDNLATACNKCNGCKSAATLDKWGERPMEKPVKGKYGEPQHWDGLSSLFILLARRDPAALTAGERGWLRALG
jgi:5-methylcytosine-specific restriction endonuclease McrA